MITLIIPCYNEQMVLDRVKQLSVGKGETFSVKDVITT